MQNNINDININNIISGKISGIKPYGIFLNCNGFNAFCHISELSNNFISNINDEFKIGQVYNGKVLKIDNEHNRVNISIKSVDNTTVDIKPPTNKKNSPSKTFKKDTYKNTNITDFSVLDNKKSSENEEPPSFESMLKKFLKKSDDKQKDIARRARNRKGK